MLQYIILGFIQGITEFLPISSSGHLVIMQRLFNIDSHLVTFDVIVHLGTLLSVIVYFRNDIRNAIQDRHLLQRILIAAFTSCCILALVDKFSEQLFSSAKVAGVGLCITASVLFFSRKVSQNKKTFQDLSKFDAFVIGIVQGISGVPGISRSGSTITMAMFRKQSPESAFRFSFLISIPVIIIATIYKSKGIFASSFPTELLLPYGVSMCVAFIVGYVSLWILFRCVARGLLHVFGWYCALLGILILFTVG